MFFTCQVSAFKLQSFSCNDLANDKTAKTVFSHLNKVQRDWQNLLIISRACYIENLDKQIFRKIQQKVYYIEVQLMINFQCPAFLDVNNFCNKHLFTKLLSQFLAVHVNFILVGLFCIHRQLSFGHMLTFIHYIKLYFMFVFLDCVCCREDFIKSRFIILRFCSIHFIVILTELKKIVHYTEDFVIQRIIRLNRGSTVVQNCHPGK